MNETQILGNLQPRSAIPFALPTQTSAFLQSAVIDRVTTIKIWANRNVRRLCSSVGQALIFSAAGLLLGGMWVTPSAFGQAGTKPKLGKEADLPQFSYPVAGTAIQLLEADPETFKKFASQVRTDLDSVFKDYDVEDPSVLIHLLSHQLDLQMLFEQDQDALETCAKMRDLFDKPELKTMGMFNDVTFIRTRMTTGSSDGPAFQRDYEARFRDQVNALPWAVVSERIVKIKSKFEKLSLDSVRSRVVAEIEPTISKNHALDFSTATRLIFWRGVLNTELPQREIVLSVLNDYIRAHATADSGPAGNAWWERVKFLADDSLEGRFTGSEGLKKGEAYAVEEFSKAGLQPAGTDGYYQRLAFDQFHVNEANSSLSLVSEGKETKVSFPDDAFISSQSTRNSVRLSAPLVFVGYGLKIPEMKLDELAGQDLRGKIVVYMRGSPADIPTGLSAHYQTLEERWKFLREAGAIGVVSIQNPASLDLPWQRFAFNRNSPALDLTGPEFDVRQGLKLFVMWNPAEAEKLFVGSGHTFAEVAALAKDRKPLPAFRLIPTIKAGVEIVKEHGESANVLGRLPGSDPKLKDENVVLSAHIDHLGIGEAIDGDNIYRGAMDDAAGAAVLLDIAATFKVHPEMLKRSVIFLLTTGEEKGLLGSRYIARHPTVPIKSIVADINVDMFLPIVPMKILVIGGLEESDLGASAADVAETMGVRPIADPEPLRNVFIRSDQYSFVRIGVPAVKVDIGFEPGSPEQKTMKDWLAKRYHAPSDDLKQPVNLESAAQYEDFTKRLLIVTANRDGRPSWNPDSFFRRYETK